MIPDKIYVFQHGVHAFDPLWHFIESREKHTESHEYIRKDIVDETVEVAEDHAYFAGKEKLREAILVWTRETEEMRERVPIEAYNNEDYQAGFIDGFDKFRRMLTEHINSL